MELYFIVAAIIIPALCALFCLVFRSSFARKVLIAISSIVLFGASGYVFYLLQKNGGQFLFKFDGIITGDTLSKVIMIFDFAILLYMMYIGFKLKKPLIWVFSVIQLIGIAVFKFTSKIPAPSFDIRVDYLSLVMILLISVIGPLIVIYAQSYMKTHEEHHHLKVSRQPRFFAVLLVFLAAMNGLVITGNLMWMYFFWEITTLCSFLLISHDETEEAINNGARALWMNSLGGIAFVGGIIWSFRAVGTVDIFEIMEKVPTPVGGLLLPAIALFVFAGLTKSAQFPFQSWLLGAMVAPTPVSALLHSSTMVKAGVYIVLRTAPVFQGTMMSDVLAIVGGFSFLAGAALAVSQRNAKKVLAYSTIANLGLIVACAGLGSHLAISAAILLIIFHAISKALLFLCVGTIDQKIGSKDIEDMPGIMKKLPFTTTVAVIGMLTMLLPPFGMLLTKWMAIEAAVKSPAVLILIVLGSAFVIVFWTKWIGQILTMPSNGGYEKDGLAPSMGVPLFVLTIMAVFASVLVSPLFNKVVAPYVGNLYYDMNNLFAIKGVLTDIMTFSPESGVLGGFSIMGFFVILIAIVIYIPYFMSLNSKGRIRKPYLCGENTDEDEGAGFMAPMDKPVVSASGNFYLKNFLSEEKLTSWFNFVAVLMILVMFGVIMSW